ncbi:hypothetical protein NKG05_24875 [Oerskovia sp. M15]
MTVDSTGLPGTTDTRSDAPTAGAGRRRTGGRRPRATRSAGLALLALAVGGFTIGTTEFATMGLLPDIAAAFDASIP